MPHLERDNNRRGIVTLENNGRTSFKVDTLKSKRVDLFIYSSQIIVAVKVVKYDSDGAYRDVSTTSIDGNSGTVIEFTVDSEFMAIELRNTSGSAATVEFNYSEVANGA